MDKSKSGDEQKRSPAGDRGREGFGDDAGTRVGRPTPAKGADGGADRGADREGGEFSHGPSTRVVDEGLEGAVLDDADEAADAGKRRALPGDETAGNEAARGIHEAQSDQAGGTRGGTNRRGSEPLEGREREHESNYGGKMGKPRKA